MEESLLREIETNVGKHVGSNPFWLVCILLEWEIQTKALLEMQEREVTAKIEGHLHRRMVGVWMLTDL